MNRTESKGQRQQQPISVVRWRHRTKMSLFQGKRHPNYISLASCVPLYHSDTLSSLCHTCSEPGGSMSWLRVSILRGDVGRSGKRSAAVLLGLQESSSSPADSNW